MCKGIKKYIKKYIVKEIEIGKIMDDKENKLVWMIKLKQNFNRFNKNQKVFVLRFTGQQSYYVIGKYKGNGRYIKQWIKSNGSISWVEIKQIEMPISFCKKYKIPGVNEILT